MGKMASTASMENLAKMGTMVLRVYRAKMAAMVRMECTERGVFQALRVYKA
jgi:hypothetical protein